MTGNRIIEFEEEGAIFILPENLDHIFIWREELATKQVKLSDPRPVIRVDIKNVRETDEVIPFGDAEITLIVYYNYDDMVRANKAGEESPYIIIDGEPFKGDLLAHRTISDSKKWLGYIMVKLNRIGDPLISVGP